MSEADPAQAMKWAVEAEARKASEINVIHGRRHNDMAVGSNENSMWKARAYNESMLLANIQ